MPEKQVERDPLQSFNLEFNIEKRIAIALQNVPQPRQFGKLLRRCTRNVVSGDLRVMDDNRLFILGEANVKFESIAAIGQSSIERRDCVFRDGVDRARSTVAKQQRPTDDGSIRHRSVEIEI